eukprot:450587_1
MSLLSFLSDDVVHCMLQYLKTTEIFKYRVTCTTFNRLCKNIIESNIDHWLFVHPLFNSMFNTEFITSDNIKFTYFLQHKYDTKDLNNQGETILINKDGFVWYLCKHYKFKTKISGVCGGIVNKPKLYYDKIYSRDVESGYGYGGKTMPKSTVLYGKATSIPHATVRSVEVQDDCYYGDGNGGYRVRATYDMYPVLQIDCLYRTWIDIAKQLSAKFCKI